MQKHKAFTMIELIFVIVVIAILSKFGSQFLAQSYNGFISTKVNNELQAKGEFAVEFIAKRLQYRIKKSTIARQGLGGAFNSLTLVNGAAANTYTVLEWVGYDIDNFRGVAAPNWSGILDLTNTVAVGNPDSPDTNTTATSNFITSLSQGASTVGIASAALYFIDGHTNIQNGYGWDGNLTAINLQQGSMHPVTNVPLTQRFQSSTLTAFAGNGVEVSEHYQLAWSAYAVSLENFNATTKKGDLFFYYNYQPWNGGSTTNNNRYRVLLMEDVSTFQFIGVGDIIKIQVCTKSDLIAGETYSLCKEKTIF
jgi:prepilin-type N-terminal cleavage/methylation domain-containing protein